MFLDVFRKTAPTVGTEKHVIITGLRVRLLIVLDLFLKLFCHLIGACCTMHYDRQYFHLKLIRFVARAVSGQVEM